MKELTVCWCDECFKTFKRSDIDEIKKDPKKMFCIHMDIDEVYDFIKNN